MNIGNQRRRDSWADGKTQALTNLKADQTITIKYSEASNEKNISQPVAKTLFEEVDQKLIEGDATHHENVYDDFNDEILLIRMLSTEGPRIIKGDVNKDNLTDFILLGAAGDPDKLFLQKPDGKFHFQPTPAFNKIPGTFESTCHS